MAKNTAVVDDVEVSEVATPQAVVAPQAVIAQAVREVQQDPHAVAKMAVEVYNQGYQAGLRVGLELERRPQKKKSWLD